MSERFVEFTRSGNLVAHGGVGSAYNNHDCRCDECTAAHTAVVKRRRAERDPATGTFEHGASGYSNWKCRCHKCRRGHAEERRRQYADRRARRAGGTA